MEDHPETGNVVSFRRKPENPEPVADLYVETELLEAAWRRLEALTNEIKSDRERAEKDLAKLVETRVAIDADTAAILAAVDQAEARAAHSRRRWGFLPLIVIVLLVVALWGIL